MHDTETRPRRADALRNRQRLLDAARAAFAEHGTGASLEDVARRAGVGVGTLYRHFPHRDDLVEALVRGGVDGLVELSARLAADLDRHKDEDEDEDGTGAGGSGGGGNRDADAFAALRTWLQALVRHALAYRGLAEQLVTAAGSGNRLDSACHDTADAGRMLFERARAAGRIRPDVQVEDAIDLATAVAWAVELTGRDDPDRLLDVVLDGLRPR
ncbi:MAG TPA: helix-turn-helix domain-containing protein [Acidimicrobiales bacterium]